MKFFKKQLKKLLKKIKKVINLYKYKIGDLVVIKGHDHLFKSDDDRYGVIIDRKKMYRIDLRNYNFYLVQFTNGQCGSFMEEDVALNKRRVNLKGGFMYV